MLVVIPIILDYYIMIVIVIYLRPLYVRDDTSYDQTLLSWKRLIFITLGTAIYLPWLGAPSFI